MKERSRIFNNAVKHEVLILVAFVCVNIPHPVLGRGMVGGREEESREEKERVREEEEKGRRRREGRYQQREEEKKMVSEKIRNRMETPHMAKALELATRAHMCVCLHMKPSNLES